MKSKKNNNFFKRNLQEIKDTLFPYNPNETRAQRRVRKIGWFMFLLLMSCISLAIVIALSFAH